MGVIVALKLEHWP